MGLVRADRPRKDAGVCLADGRGMRLWARVSVRHRLFRVCGLRHPWLATILPSMNPRRFAVLLFVTLGIVILVDALAGL